MIAIVDYGVGNLFSLQSSLGFLKIETVVTRNPNILRKADRIVLPGVGAFADAAEKLENTGLIPVIKEEVGNGKPLLGICLGMQLLFDKSFEYGQHEGLGLIKGTVNSLEEALEEYPSLKVPHIGWNRLNQKTKHPLLKYVKNQEYVYYVHSYMATGCQESVIASSTYGVEIPGVVGRKNVYGTQFHPEKSGKTGLAILQAFQEL